VETRRYKSIEEARGFLEACRDRHISVSLDSDGRLVFSDPESLSAELRAMLLVCRDSIVTYLRSLDDMERYSRAWEMNNEQARPDVPSAGGNGGRLPGTNGSAGSPRSTRPASGSDG
jgi:hypothetical protein